MVGVFLSYARDDTPKARQIAAALEKAGHNVWWDLHVRGGTQFSKVIEEALKAADVVVVLWSERSVESPWVRDEAASGRDRGRLVPVSLDGCEPPLGFRQFQTIDLPGGRIGRGEKSALLGAIDVAGGGPPTPITHGAKAKSRSIRRGWMLAGIGALLLVVLGGLLVLRPWAGRSEVVLAIGPAAPDHGSRALASELAVKLGAMQSSSVLPVRLVEASDSNNADLVLSAAATGPASASLVLKSARDLAILWSKEFEQPSGNRADLLLQLALTSGRITACAVEGLDGPVRLKPATLKVYLNACAQLAEIGIVEPEMPTLLLPEVLKDAPRFTPAWSKLLLAESEMASPEYAQGDVDPAMLARVRRHVAEARKVDPDLPEAMIAEAQLLPANDFAGRTALIERAARQKPNDPAILTILAGTLSETGMQTQSIKIARRAAQLDPLSPGIQSVLIATLAYSGALEAAQRELARAEKSWPGTASVRDAQYRFHLRYGDPQIALAMFEEQNDAGGRAPRLYLEARADPSPQKIETLFAYVSDRLQNMENPSAGIGFATLAFGYFGRKNELFDTLLSWPSTSDVAIISEVLFRPEFADVRRDPRFLQIAKRAGLLEYWRQSGNWPDFCFAEGHTYNCKAEAAKLN